MAFDATTRRRWVGGMALLAALGMLVGGQTVFMGRLDGLAFLLYWLFCFGLTFVAIVVALWDARALRQRSRQEQRELLHNTLGEIITEAKSREAGASGEKPSKGRERGEVRN